MRWGFRVFCKIAFWLVTEMFRLGARVFKRTELLRWGLFVWQFPFSLFDGMRE